MVKLETTNKILLQLYKSFLSDGFFDIFKTQQEVFIICAMSMLAWYKLQGPFFESFCTGSRWQWSASAIVKYSISKHIVLF